jgi:hypothetical protein
MRGETRWEEVARHHPRSGAPISGSKEAGATGEDAGRVGSWKGNNQDREETLARL